MPESPERFGVSSDSVGSISVTDFLPFRSLWFELIATRQQHSERVPIQTRYSSLLDTDLQGFWLGNGRYRVRFLDHCGSWVLSPNLTSGIATLWQLRSKVTQPSKRVEGYQPRPLRPHRVPVTPRPLVVQFYWCTLRERYPGTKERTSANGRPLERICTSLVVRIRTVSWFHLQNNGL